jgi:outer membrane receptor protein involved in Fe transport
MKIQPSGEKWSLSLYGKNLTDARYRLVGLTVGPLAIIAVAPTRSIGLDIGYSF